MTLKIGLIGCGGITRAHVEGWKTVAGRAQYISMDIANTTGLW